MKAITTALAGAGMALILLAGCAIFSNQSRGTETRSVQFLYRSSGFADFESFSSIALVMDRTFSFRGDDYCLTATLRYNDMPGPDTLVIRADQDEMVLRDGRPRTIRQLVGNPRFTTRLSFDLDEEQVRRLRSARRIVVQYGDQRLTLTVGERRALRRLLTGAPAS